jgi:hypothetical protein
VDDSVESGKTHRFADQSFNVELVLRHCGPRLACVNACNVLVNVLWGGGLDPRVLTLVGDHLNGASVGHGHKYFEQTP